MVVVAQRLERLPVEQEAAGSIPVDHPKKEGSLFQVSFSFFRWMGFSNPLNYQ